MTAFYENDRVRIEVEPNEIPWLKIFAQQQCKEFSECDPETRRHIFDLLDLIEREMIAYFQPEKINIASFANYVPQVHWHIMARFREDSYFPEPVWGQKQRNANLELPSLEIFLAGLKQKLAQPAV